MSNRSLNLFLAACGAGGPLQLGVSYPGEPEILRRSFRQPFVVVGTNPATDLPLEDSQVSDCHAYLQLIGGRVFCVDLGSRAGIQWGHVTGRWGWVQPRQGIRVGGCHLHLLEDATERAGPVRPPENPLAAQGAGAGYLPEVSLEFRNGSAPKKPWRMNRLLTLVGRAAECKIHLIGARISQFHCSLVRTAQGVWIIDLVTRDGTFVNGQPVRCVLLEDGDELRVGNLMMRWHYGTPPLPTPDPADPGLSEPGDGEAAGPVAPAPPECLENGEEIGSSLVPLGPLLPSSLTAANQPLGYAPGSSIRKPEQADSILFPLVEQFAAMQQQMFSQFQQSMVMMFQMFNAAQKEQMGQVRQELDRLHDITRELTALQAELVRNQLAASAVQPSGPPRSPLGPAGAGPEPMATNGSLGGRMEPTAPGPGPTRDTPKSPAPPGAGGPSTPTPAPAPDIHAWLTQRIAGLEEERQGRWQKIINFFRRK